VGGGINGTGIARDAAGRGFKVLLVGRTISRPAIVGLDKLVHGGLRYLEARMLRLGREALIEREVMLRWRPPHPADPLRAARRAGPAPTVDAALGSFSSMTSRRPGDLPATRTLALAN